MDEGCSPKFLMHQRETSETKELQKITLFLSFSSALLWKLLQPTGGERGGERKFFSCRGGGVVVGVDLIKGIGV